MRDFTLALMLLQSAIFFSCDTPTTPPPETPKSATTARDKTETPATVPDAPIITFANPSFQKGVALGLFVSDERPAKQIEIYKTLIDEIVDTGATHLSITIRWHQDDVRANTIEPGTLTASDDVLTSTLAYAKQKGLAVFLMPYLNLKQKQGADWRGVLAPDDRQRWWKSYYAFILHYAKIGADNDIALFAVGSELLSMDRDLEQWKRLIAEVRELLPKTKLTYSANWDRFETVRFWSDLDYVGISAYQPLARTPEKKSDFANGWRRFRHRLSELRQRVPTQKVIFTEAGYPSNSNAAVRPWDYTVSGTYAPELQSALLTSLFEVWAPKTFIEGIYVWNWFGKGGQGDRGYALRGKPAEKVLTRIYSAP